MDDISTPEHQESEHKTEQATTLQQSMAVPIAIVISGALIGISIWYTGGMGKTPNQPVQALKTPPSVDRARPVDPARDHMLGSVSAPVALIEYADLECPYCKDYHKVVEATLKSYIASGQVKLVYRHLPLVDIHPKAMDEAIAAVCVSRVSGNDAFWKYVGRIFAVTPSNNKLDPEKLDTLAIELGVNMDTFSACRANPDVRTRIEEDTEDAIAAGATGTPFTVLIAADGSRFGYSGLMSTAQLEERIKAALTLRK